MISPAPVAPSPTWLLHAKYRAPRLSEQLVIRNRLLARFQGPAIPQLTTIFAPPGFGKTTFLAALHGSLLEQSAQAAWLTLDSDDNDCTRLVLYLIAALGESGLPLGPLADCTQEGLPPSLPRDLLGSVLEHIESSQNGVYLLLDDIDEIRSPPALEFVRTLIRNAPSNLHVITAGRTRPALHLGELRARGQLEEIDLDDLRFTVEEAQALFGDDISQEQIAALIRKVEGWPIVLKLTQHWIRKGPQALQSIAQAINHSAQLTQYLSEEIFTTLSPELVDFLSCISIHERVCTDLAYALTGREDSGALLRQLAEENHLLLPVEDDPLWYRHHKLTLHFFRDHLQCRHIGDIRELHRQAAEWFATHDDLECAIRHAELADDHAFVLHLTEKGGGWLTTLREGGASLHVLHGLENVSVTDYPKAQLGKVFAALQVGTVIQAREAFEVIRRSTNNFQLDGSQGANDTFRFESKLFDNLLKYYEDQPMDLRQVESLNETIATTPGIDLPIVSFPEAVLCCGYLDTAQYDRCRDVGGHVLANIKDRNLRHVEYYMHLMTGISYLHQGRLRLAQSSLESAREIAVLADDENIFHLAPAGGESNVHLAFAEILLAELCYERGDVTSAQLLVERSLPLIETSGGFLDVLASGYTTLTALAAHEQDLDEVRTVLEHAGQVAQDLRLGRLDNLMQIHLARELLRHGETEEAAGCCEAMDAHLRLPLDEVPVRDLRICGTARLADARRLLSLEKFEDALSRVEALEAVLAKYGFQRLMLEARMIKACCLTRMGQIEAAGTELKAGVEFAMEEQYYRFFIDEKAMLSDVLAVHQSHPDSVCRDETAYLQKLISSPPDGDREAAKERPLLSPRETEVLLHLGDGLSNKEIARKIDISEGTVKVYRKNLYRKLDVHSRSGVIKKGRMLGLLQELQQSEQQRS